MSSNPALPRIPQDPIKRSRFQGCLLGGAVGDALGAVVEFLSLEQIHAKFGPDGIRDFVPAYGRIGAITDDTQMTLFTADGMLRAYVRFCQRGIGPVYASVTARAYLRWLKTQGTASPLLADDDEPGWLMTHRDLFHRRAPGTTCLSALMQMKSFDQAGRNNSKGCGGVMRAAPVGMFMANWPDKNDVNDPVSVNVGLTFKIGVEIAAITHGHPTGQLTAGVLAVIIALVLIGQDLPEAVRHARTELQRHVHHEETLAAIDHAQRLAASGVASTKALAELGEGWVAEEALAIGLYCALTATDFESAVILAVNHDGDSDSTGSITGNLLGAALGLEAIPERWLDQVEMRDVIAGVANDLGSVREWQVDEYCDDAEGGFYWKRYPGF